VGRVPRSRSCGDSPPDGHELEDCEGAAHFQGHVAIQPFDNSISVPLDNSLKDSMGQSAREADSFARELWQGFDNQFARI